MTECPNCGNQVDDDTLTRCPYCDFLFEYNEKEASKNKWYFLAFLILILVIATPFLTIIWLFP